MKKRTPVPHRVALAIREFEQALLAPSTGPAARCARLEKADARLRESIAAVVAKPVMINTPKVRERIELHAAATFGCSRSDPEAFFRDGMWFVRFNRWRMMKGPNVHETWKRITGRHYGPIVVELLATEGFTFLVYK